MVKLPPDQSSLLAIYQNLDPPDRASLRAFAEFLAARAGEKDEKEGSGDPPAESTDPNPIPRPVKETVIGAIKRLSETYYMIDRKELLTETSALMSAHVMRGRAAADVIDDLEALFAAHYERYAADSD